MLEVKGHKSKLVKLTNNNELDEADKYISSYASNGAVHYAKAILKFTPSHQRVLAIGSNGRKEGSDIIQESQVWYLSKENLFKPKLIWEGEDVCSILSNSTKLSKLIDEATLTDEELAQSARNIENAISDVLKRLNQEMHDNLSIPVGSRVQLIVGMILAGIGHESVAPLEIEDLKGNSGPKTHDGRVIINKVEDLLRAKLIPEEKREMVINDLQTIFINTKLKEAGEDGQSRLRKVFSFVKTELMPLYISSHHLDFAGELFNTLNDWVDIPDEDKNDVVLTPRYVTEFMTSLVRVNKDSYVIDNTVGTGAFLVSAMRRMISDAHNSIDDSVVLADKLQNIKEKQLLGIEKRADIYLLGVLNMILMGDGSSNLIHGDSLEYNGRYQQGELAEEEFPANVLLMNPPYSLPGKGLIFAVKTMSRMKSGRAVILIQENAGAGQGGEYARALLQKHTLLASIKMADIFSGKAGVQTAVYVFEVGRPHEEKNIVRFIDMTNDGYTRQNRKKSSKEVNLRDTDHANERYQEVVDLINHGAKYLKYYTSEEFTEDTITLAGNDWTFAQHRVINIVPTVDDFQKIVGEYLAWEVGQILKGRVL